MTTEENRDKITAQMDHLEANQGDASFSYLRKTFSSQLDVHEWIAEEKIGSSGSFWDLFSILVGMEPKKETQTALAIKAANQSNPDILVLDLAFSMSYKRPYTIFEESLTKFVH